MPTKVEIKSKSDQSIEGVLKSRTVCGAFDTGDGVNHAFQFSLVGNDLTKPVAEQKVLLKQRIKDFIISFKKIKPISTNTGSDWNQTYTEDV